jgi:hypothetical protein
MCYLCEHLEKIHLDIGVYVKANSNWKNVRKKEENLNEIKSAETKNSTERTCCQGTLLKFVIIYKFRSSSFN